MTLCSAVQHEIIADGNHSTSAKLAITLARRLTCTLRADGGAAVLLSAVMARPIKRLKRIDLATQKATPESL